jgi:hypothetical protein
MNAYRAVFFIEYKKAIVRQGHRYNPAISMGALAS